MSLIRTSIEHELEDFRKIEGSLQVWMATNLKNAEWYMREADHQANYEPLRKKFEIVLTQLARASGRGGRYLYDSDAGYYLARRIQPHRAESPFDRPIMAYLGLPKQVRQYLSDMLVSAEKYYLGVLRDWGEFAPEPKLGASIAPDANQRLQESEKHKRNVEKYCKDEAEHRAASQYIDARLLASEAISNL